METTKGTKVALIFFGILGAIIIIICLLITFYFFRINQTFKQDKNILSLHIEENFPNEDYKIITIKAEWLGPNYIDVIYNNEKDIVYRYTIGDKNTVILLEPSTNTKNETYKHLD